MNKKIFLTLYSIYIFDFIDSLLDKPTLGMRALVSLIFLLFLLLDNIGLTINENKLLIKRFEKKQLLFSTAIVVVYAIGLLSDNAEIKEFIDIFLFINIIFFSFKFIYRNRILQNVLWITYVISFIVLIFQYFWAGAPTYKFIGLENTFFQSWDVRIRENLGFYHPNACGNLAYINFAISSFLFAIYINQKKKSILPILLMILMDFFSIFVILLTNSRNSLLSLFIFLCIIGYYKLLGAKSLSRSIRLILRLLLITLIAFIVVINFEIIDTLFITSNRQRNFTYNLPLLNTIIKKLFGLGTISPNTYGTRSIWPNSFYVDNYYLYILMDFGIIGLILICTILFNIGLHLHSNIKKSDYSTVSIIAFSLFMTQLFMGMGETCIIYPIFLSSFVVLLTCFVFYDGDYISFCH